MLSGACMTSDLAIFVSKRVQRVVAAVLCLMALQLTISLSSCHPEFAPSAAVRVHVGN